MFFVKKLVSRFFFPVPLCAGLLLLGLGLWYFTKCKRAGRGCVVAGTVLLLLFSYPWLAARALRQLENQVALMSNPNTNSHLLSCNYICVLGLSVSADTNLPPNVRFSDIFLKRIVEGVRLHRLLPDSTLLVSIAGPNMSKEEKQAVLGDLLLIFGLQTSNVQVCATARETDDEIAWFKQVAGTNWVFLVSCASHLPRAMVLAHKHALNAIPRPSGYLAGTVVEKSAFSTTYLFPNSGNLCNSEQAIYEYLGLAWEKVRSTWASEGRGQMPAGGGQ
jgi:uncharacterized SAM-binding protein YcdF (DUF218 family)